jgi:hypothetical protein
MKLRREGVRSPFDLFYETMGSGLEIGKCGRSAGRASRCASARSDNRAIIRRSLPVTVPAEGKPLRTCERRTGSLERGRTKLNR